MTPRHRRLRGSFVGEVPDPDAGWRLLDVFGGWIRHADAKAGTTLAAAGVVGGVLFAMIDDDGVSADWVAVTAAACGWFVVLAGIFSALALIPRVRLPKRYGAGISPLHFHDVTADHPPADAASFACRFTELASQPRDLTWQLALQVHALAHVAHRKMKWAGRGIASLVVSIAALALVAVGEVLARTEVTERIREIVSVAIDVLR